MTCSEALDPVNQALLPCPEHPSGLGSAALLCAGPGCHTACEVYRAFVCCRFGSCAEPSLDKRTADLTCGVAGCSQTSDCRVS